MSIPEATRRTFLPFRSLGVRGRLALAGVRLDGRALPLPREPSEVLELGAARFASLEVDLRLDLPVELGELLPRGERVPADVRVVAIAEDPSTWYRSAIRLAPEVPPSLGGTLRIPARAVGRAVAVRAVVCRAGEARAPGADLPSGRGEPLMETAPLTIRLGSEPVGGDALLSVRWRRFSAAPALRARLGQPWHLELSDPPVLWLNAELDELVRALGAQGAPAMRELLFRTIGASCWPVLFHAASAGLGADETGAPTFAAGWHREVLAVVAERALPEIEEGRRFDHLLGLVAEAREAPELLGPLLEDVTLGTVRGMDLAGVLSRALSEGP